MKGGVMFEDIDGDGLPLPDWLPMLDRGRHEPSQLRLCAMEAAAWLAGEERSDRPRSVHPVIAQAARVANDTASDEERQELWPLVLASIGTGARWRPRLWYRLMQHGLITQRRYPGNPRKVWEELLKEHALLTGRGPVRLSLAPSDRATRTVAELAEFVAAGAPDTTR